MEEAKRFYRRNDNVILERQLFGHGVRRAEIETRPIPVLKNQSSRNEIPRFNIRKRDLTSTALCYGALLY